MTSFFGNLFLIFLWLGFYSMFAIAGFALVYYGPSLFKRKLPAPSPPEHKFRLVACTQCHQMTTCWISFRRENASSSVIHANFLCSKCGHVTRIETTDEEIAGL